MAKLCLSSSLSWAELTIFPINPLTHPDKSEQYLEKLLVYSKTHKHNFGPHPAPKNSTIGPKKAQNDP